MIRFVRYTNERDEEAQVPRSDTHDTTAPHERRQRLRFPLGLPVRIHLAGATAPVTVELVDLSSEGGRFRSAVPMARDGQLAAIAFVLPGERRCLAKGRVVWTEPSGEFALMLEKANDAFLGFVRDLSR